MLVLYSLFPESIGIIYIRSCSDGHLVVIKRNACVTRS